MSESVYVAEVPPVHKITFSEEFSSIFFKPKWIHWMFEKLKI